MSTKKKPMFHSPQKTGVLRKIPTTLPVKILSWVSLAVLAALTAFSIYAASTKGDTQVALYADFTMRAGLVFLFLPILAWILAIGFRVAVRTIPLEMWRLPQSVKTATLKTEGKYLKLTTLLLELEVGLGFWYMTLSMYNGIMPQDVPVLIWFAVIIGTVIFFGRYVLIAAERQSDIKSR